MMTQALLITVLGMGATFAALALVLVSLILLTRLATRSVQSPEPRATETPPGPTAAPEPTDLELPAGTPLAAVAAAAVSVAAARELARQRHSAEVWLRHRPPHVLSPWQLVSREQVATKSRRR